MFPKKEVAFGPPPFLRPSETRPNKRPNVTRANKRAETNATKYTCPNKRPMKPEQTNALKQTQPNIPAQTNRGKDDSHRFVTQQKWIMKTFLQNKFDSYDFVS